jgi:hypothetical protein
MDSTPPLATETITYGWSLNRSKYFHKARGYPGNMLTLCGYGQLVGQTSTERHHVPSNLKPCRKCFQVYD